MNLVGMYERNYQLNHQRINPEQLLKELDILRHTFECGYFDIQVLMNCRWERSGRCGCQPIELMDIFGHMFVKYYRRSKRLRWRCRCSSSEYQRRLFLCDGHILVPGIPRHIYEFH